MTLTDRPLRRVVAVTVVAVALSALVALFVDLPFGPGGGPGMGPGMGPGQAMGSPFGPLVQAKVFLSTFNLIVLLALGWSYLSLYRELPNGFTASLLVVTAALFLYALSSNPVIPRLFGFRGGPGLGPFTFLPDLFAAVAVVLLLYQSYR
ncbi:MAG: hypothetical protein ABEJ28_04030 [Salinigranum sp.]